MAWRRHQTGRTARPVADWITREFASRGLVPPHCTPEALARALERERGITIAFACHVSDDPGVYGLLHRPEGRPRTCIILLRHTPSLALRRLIMFHELAHLLFGHALHEVAGEGELCGYLIADADDAKAEAFAAGAMQLSFLDPDAQTGPADVPEDVSPSAFGQFFKRTRYLP